MMSHLLSSKGVGTVFDIGGNYGAWTDLILSTLNPREVIVFEPFPDHFRNLLAKYESEPQVKVYDMAVGSVTGEVDFHINSDPRFNHSLLTLDPKADDWVTVDHTHKVSVSGVTVDSFCEGHNINEIDVLKVDTEGADFLVLKGAQNMLEKGGIALVYLEVFLKPLMNNQGSLVDVVQFMEDLGYRIVNFYDHRYRDGRLVLTNIMFARPDILQDFNAG
jgi:FkbM family methyltransferase